MATVEIEAGLHFVRWFEEITIDDVPIVGGKNASLGEMCRELGPQGINLAGGFAITAEAYRHFLRESGLNEKVHAILTDLDTSDVANLQARPETVQSQKQHEVLEFYELKEKGRVLTSGRSVGEKIGCGPARVIKNVEHLGEVKAGDVLVTDKTDPDWEPTTKKAAAIVTNRGGRTCHAAIVSRELGLPAIVGTNNGTEVLRSGQAWFGASRKRSRSLCHVRNPFQRRPGFGNRGSRIR